MTNFARFARTAATIAATATMLLGTDHVPVAAGAPSSAAPTTASAGASTTRDSGARIVLGDLDPRVDAASVGAPFDPCKIAWDVFPAQVRPDKPVKPRLRAPKSGDIFSTACKFENSGAAELKPGEQAGLGKTFMTLIAWAKPSDGMSANPAEHPNATAAQFKGKPGLLKPTTNKASGEAQCTAIVDLGGGRGVAGVSITNGRFAAVDTCTIAQAVGDAVATAAR